MAAETEPGQRTRFEDILACARLADELHRRGQRALAHNMIEAMYCLFTPPDNVIAMAGRRPTPPILKLVANVES